MVTEFLNSVKRVWVSMLLRWLSGESTDILRTISVTVISSLVTKTEMVLKTFVHLLFNHLALMISPPPKKKVVVICCKCFQYFHIPYFDILTQKFLPLVVYILWQYSWMHSLYLKNWYWQNISIILSVKSNETPTWCNTVQVLFLQGHSTCFGRKRPSSGVFKTSTAATGTCVL